MAHNAYNKMMDILKVMLGLRRTDIEEYAKSHGTLERLKQLSKASKAKKMNFEDFSQELRGILSELMDNLPGRDLSDSGHLIVEFVAEAHPRSGQLPNWLRDLTETDLATLKNDPEA